MYINHALFLLLRKVPPESAITAWLNVFRGTALAGASYALYSHPDIHGFHANARIQFANLSPDEVENIYNATKSLLNSDDLPADSGVFGLLAYAVDDILRLDSWGECLCRFSELVNFRELSHPIGQEVFVAAYLAAEDHKRKQNRYVFAFPPVVRTDHIRLHQLLEKGMAENHFHIGGSVSASLYSWICLMNHMNVNRREEFLKAAMDTDPLDQEGVGLVSMESMYSLVFKAVCIRYFLFLRLHDSYPHTTHAKDADEEDEMKTQGERWLKDRLEARESYFSFYMTDLNSRLSMCRTMYCESDEEDGFIPDYAMENEPQLPTDDNDLRSSYDRAVRNYERRVYRSIAGEQHIQYSLIRAIFDHDPRIMPYADLVYAYFLIYCKFRSEMIQTNINVGFQNFENYQNRKEQFTQNYPQYERLRSRVAQQAVILNPQILSFEGRMVPAETSSALVNKILLNYRNAAETGGYRGTELEKQVRECADEKLHYVLHFIKRHQPISDNEIFESTNPRDSVVRRKAWRQAQAILKARRDNQEFTLCGDLHVKPMNKVTGIDACSNEIGCRPEVFAPAFREIRQTVFEPGARFYQVGADVLPSIRITYHVGEDFLDLADGLRAIDEAIRFLELGSGDRLGHAIALGADVGEWYAFKKYTVILPKQGVMDNMAWLMGKMHEFNIYDRAAESEIQRVFHELYNDLILKYCENTSCLWSADIMDYYESMRLRGNDPELYSRFSENDDEEVKRYTIFQNGIYEAEKTAPWRILRGCGNTTDRIALALYNTYHYNAKSKAASDALMEYRIPYCMVRVIDEIQRKMQKVVASLDLGIECNPSSNYLIGTFRDYCKHPIFAFNDTGLYDSSDNPHIFTSINTDDLGVFDTTLENEYALMACALKNKNDYTHPDEQIPLERIYAWLDHIREMGCDQSFQHIVKH